MPSKKIACIGKDCVACGNCAEHCPFGAIGIYKGLYALVDESKCKGCGKCVNACPAGIIACEPKEVASA